LKYATDASKVKILFAQGGDRETVWATKIGDERYQLENLLFTNYGFALGDIVETLHVDGEQLPHVKRAWKRSKHSAYRVFLADQFTTIEQTKYWSALSTLGCTFERATRGLFAIDVPSSSDIHEVYRYLELGESISEWSFEEVFCGRDV
jgi:hypothetical protein